MFLWLLLCTSILSYALSLSMTPSRMGRFSSNTIASEKQHSFTGILEAIKIYKAHNGNTLVPVRFQVPSEVSWPEHLWGMNLGAQVMSIRNLRCYVGGYPNRLKLLNDIGFVWDVTEYNFKILVEALSIYKGIHGDLLVPASFTVPYDDGSSWPEHLWGTKLGSHVSDIRSKEYYIKYSSKRSSLLRDMGFVVDVTEHNFKVIVSALRTFKAIHGHLLVPARYKVPRDSSWPRNTWDMNLGRHVSDIRCRLNYVRDHPMRLKQLNDMGFSWQMNARSSHYMV